MSAPKQPRLPLAPLIEFTGLLPGAELALRCGVTRRSLHRAAVEGLTPWMADRAATAAGRHPSELWGVDWWDLVEGDGEAA